jgi:hypothetical protein
MDEIAFQVGPPVVEISRPAESHQDILLSHFLAFFHGSRGTELNEHMRVRLFIPEAGGFGVVRTLVSLRTEGAKFPRIGRVKQIWQGIVHKRIKSNLFQPLAFSLQPFFISLSFERSFGGGPDDVAHSRPGCAHNRSGVGIDGDRDGAGAKHGTAAKSGLIGMGREQLASGRVGE